MTKLSVLSLRWWCFAGSSLLAAAGDSAALPRPVADQTVPSYDMKAQSALDLELMQKKS